MKAMMIILLNVCLAMGLSAQNNPETKLTKEEKKALRDSANKLEYKVTENMIDSMDFVLEAYYLSNRYGQRVPVSSNINFIKVDSMNTVIQTGREASVGSNGVGGVTAEGNITKWKVDKDPKHKTFFVNMDVMTSVGMYSVALNVSSSGRATARLTGLWPGELNWEGQIVPIEHSRTYKGRTSY